MRRFLALPLLTLLACASHRGEAAGPRGPRPGPLTFIEDDYPRALALARSTHRPLFVDAWAPWCHTCVSLRSYVFPDPLMGVVSGRFVWLSIDTEKPRNEAFVAQFPIQAWPTLFVLDPASERPVRRWLGSMTAAELSSRLTEVADAQTPGAAPRPVQDALARGSAASSEGHPDDAKRAFQDALAASAPGTLEHLQALEALLGLLSASHSYRACADLAQAEIPRTPPGTVLATVAEEALHCALALPEKDEGRERTLTATEARVAHIAADASVGMLPDDRSSLYETLVDARKAQKDEAGAQQAAAAWSAFLEAEAARAPTPAARAVFDSHRLGAYMELHQTEKAIPMLEQSERDFPEDYNPPARLAVAYLKLQRPTLALAAARRAEKRVYGPRTIRVLLTLADAQAALGQRSELEATLARAEQVVAGLPSVDQGRLRTAVQEKRRQLLN